MILKEIVEKKKETLAKMHYTFSLSELYEQGQKKGRESFLAALKKPGLSIIGEIKRASPSKGVFSESFDPLEIAKAYDGICDCISVLTEEHFFLGKAEYVSQVHQAVSLPLLRKDFIISPLQIIEAYELGASAVLLITAILDKTTLQEYIKLCAGLGLSALVEVHNEEELKKAIAAGASIIGINNRNLLDFSEDLSTTLRLRGKVPKNCAVVSESGIRTAEDVAFLREAALDGILVGESFMRCADIRNKAKELRDAYGTGYKN